MTRTFFSLLQISTNPVLTQVSVHGSDSPAPVEVGNCSDVNTDEEGNELGIDLSHHNYCELPEIKEEEGLLIDNNNDHQQPDGNKVSIHTTHSRGCDKIVFVFKHD